MTEEQIRDAYDRLDGALAGPLDAAERVERRVQGRRRRRRATVAGVAGLGVLVAGGAVVAGLSGDDGTGPTVAVDPPSTGLVLTRPDGSTYAFHDVEVTCAAPPYEGEPSGVQRIWAFSPRVIVDDRATEPFVYFQGIVSKIEGDQTFTFPNDWTTASDRFPMVLFAADTDGNEVASSAGGESGTVRVLEATCDPVPVLRLDVDMTLGSEEGMAPLKVAGTLR